MGKVIRAFRFTSTFVSKGLSASALGLYTRIKALKYQDQVSGERLQDHWSTGFRFYWLNTLQCRYITVPINYKKTLMQSIKYAAKIVFILSRSFDEQQAHVPHLLT